MSSFKNIVAHEAFPVDIKIKELRQRFFFQPVCRFSEMFEGCSSRSELVAVFLAVLELCREENISTEAEKDDILIIFHRNGEDNGK